MIKKFIGDLISKTSSTLSRKRPKFGRREEIDAQTHGIDVSLVDERALAVVKRLQEAGFTAYIVGGAVRDLLVGLRPKDFDVATDATPEEVKAQFRRAFIIGRRFRIVHVVYGRGRDHEVIEVSTFRAYLEAAAAEQVSGNEKTSRSELAGMQHAVDSSGRVLRDNVWGSQEEDAARRDFTVNAMYYDPVTQKLVDFHQGLKDCRQRVLRMIGDPATRYREDPVRIIRAVRFAAKLDALGFALEPKTLAPLQKSLQLLAEVPQSRMFDEMLKLLQTGHAVASVAQLRKLGLAQGIYPLLDLVVERASQPLIDAALRDTDRRVAEGRPVAPSFLLACVLWSDVRQAWERRRSEQQPPHPALLDAIDEVFRSRIGDVSGSGRLGADMRELWSMQTRFDRRVGSSPYSLIEQPRYRAAYDFLRLRADAGEVEVELADWWHEFSVGNDSVREDMMAVLREEQQRARRSSAPRGGAARAALRLPPDAEMAAPPAGGEAEAPDAGGVRRRRRRRRPAGGRGDAGGAPPAES